MCLKKLFNLFRKKDNLAEVVKADQELAEKLYHPKTWQGKHAGRRRRGGFLRQVSQSFSMPKRQPCPKCGGQRPRVEKKVLPTAAQPVMGALYNCNKHGNFFVARQA